MTDYQKINELTDEVEALAKIDRVLRNEHCHRCGGLMIHDHCLDVKSDSGEVEAKVLRCCACGEVIDPTILRNRLRLPNLGSKLELQTQLSSADPPRPVHHDNLMKQVLQTWSTAVLHDDIADNLQTN